MSDESLNELTDKLIRENPGFTAWTKTLPAKHWAKHDLSAARLGWEASLHAQQQPCGLREALKDCRSAIDPIINPEVTTLTTDGTLDLINAAKKADLALTQPCQQPASVGSEEKWSCHYVESLNGWSIISGPRHLSIAVVDGPRNIAPDIQLIVDAHNAALRRQSAPVEAWRDLVEHRPTTEDCDEYGYVLCRWGDGVIRTMPITHFLTNQPTRVRYWMPLQRRVSVAPKS